MCGIVGLVAKMQNGFFISDVSLFTQMLVADSVRGTDGTGVFGTYGTGSVGWLKVGSHPYALITNKKYEAWTQAMTRKFDMVVGHNRKATAGQASNDNSHPFVHEHIILVHNGTVHGHKKMADTEVDSHAIAHSIVNKGVEETVEKLDGAFALVWFDMKERALKIVRNDERPLYITESASQIAFASEGMMLKWISDRNNKSWTNVTMVPKGELLSISQATKVVSSKKIKLYTPTYYTGHQYSCGYEGGYSAYGTVADEVRDMMAEGGAVDDPLEDEDAIAAAIREDMPGLDEDETDEAVDFINKYKDGVQVIFYPGKLIPWNSANDTVKGFNLEGTLREDKDVTVRACFDATVPFLRANMLATSKILKGMVYGAMVNPNTGKKSLHVMSVTTLETYRTFNGTELTSNEWIKLCDSNRCTGCNASLFIKDISKTSVNFKSEGRIRVFCPTCVEKHVRRMPKEQQEQLLATNAAIAAVQHTTEKEWDLKGSTHGS